MRGHGDGTVTIGVSSCDFYFEVGSSYVVFGAGASLTNLGARKGTLTSSLKDAGDTTKRLDLLAEREKRSQARQHSDCRSTLTARGTIGCASH